MLSPHPQFDAILRAVRAAGPGPVLLLGGVDTGKTTLLQAVANALAAKSPVWIVDADMGQSWIGPPTCVGRALLARPRRRWGMLSAERLIFVGETSPAQCVQRSADALVRLAREGIRPRQRVLVDTPGMVQGRPAEALWRLVAKQLRPVLVVAIRRGRELAPILPMFRRAGARILVVAPDERARVRRRPQRTEYRQRAYRRYFRRARRRWLDHSRLSVRALETWAEADLAAGRPVALQDAAGRDLALGVIGVVKPKRISILTPLADLSAVAALAVGWDCVDPATGIESPCAAAHEQDTIRWTNP